MLEAPIWESIGEANGSGKIPEASVGCLALPWLPDVYPGYTRRIFGDFPNRFDSRAEELSVRWEEASPEERRGYVQARRRCGCADCKRWRREHGRRQEKR